MTAEPRDVFHVVGTLLDGKYRVDRVVAEGGFGVVYAGHQLRLDVPVAIKLLKPSRLLEGTRAELVANFLAEARTTAKLRHPNIAQVIDTGVLYADDHPEGVPWTCFEWLEGETLAAVLKRRRGSGGLPPTEAWALLGPVVDAMAAAHASGVVHRDLKPSNVMLVQTANGMSPRIMDFGIAKLVEDPLEESIGDTSTESVFVAFSPAYAAPEQISRSRTGFWTDVHALGLMFTEVLTDEKAYPVEHGTELVARVVANNRPTPGRHGVNVGSWEAVLQRALALNPRDRHANARELYRALEEALEATTFNSSRPADSPRSSRKVQRATWAVLGVGILGATAFLATQSGEEHEPAAARASSAPAAPPPILVRDAPASAQEHSATPARSVETKPPTSSPRARPRQPSKAAAAPEPNPAPASVLDTWP